MVVFLMMVEVVLMCFGWSSSDLIVLVELLVCSGYSGVSMTFKKVTLLLFCKYNYCCQVMKTVLST